VNWATKTWKAAEPVYGSIIAMPFIKELLDGSLALEKFQFYIAQDSGYLHHFSKALALIGARAQNLQDALAFIRFAEGAIVVENNLHESYFIEYSITEQSILEPACHHYIHYLKSTAALEQVEIAMAAVLPCFWIYKEVGSYIYQHQQQKDNPYQKWIDTYAGDAYGKLVEHAISICDQAAAQCTAAQQQAMTEAFLTGSRLEWLFWDGAYRQYKW